MAKDGRGCRNHTESLKLVRMGRGPLRRHKGTAHVTKSPTSKARGPYPGQEKSGILTAWDPGYSEEPERRGMERKKSGNEHWKWEDIVNRKRYKFEFARRNQRIKSLIEEEKKARSISREEWAKAEDNLYALLTKEFQFHASEVDGLLFAFQNNGQADSYMLVNTSSINIVFPNSGGGSTLPLDYGEAAFVGPDASDRFGGRRWRPVIEAIDFSTGTITVDIKLYHSIDNIRKDITYLLSLVSMELESRGKKRKGLKRQFNDYERYLKVWDRKTEGWGDRKIAKEIYPEEIADEARTKVKNLYKKATKMIEGDFAFL
jgi:hypothetical protein